MGTKKSSWTGERIGRLGFLIGLGWDAKRIADDPLIASTSNNVYVQASRLNLKFRGAEAEIALQASLDAISPFGMAALKRGLTSEILIYNLFAQIADEPCLIDNILDDGV